MGLLLELRELELTLGGKTLLDKVNFSFTDDKIIGFIGRNGTGKSTLCRLIAGEEHADYGEVYHQSSLRLGYLKQHEGFLEHETALEFLMRDSEMPDWKCSQTANKFLIGPATLETEISELSGGWRTRLKLAALMLHEPNFLILDEPTNFLDLRTQLLLESFLKSFKGGALIISHDRAFLESTCIHTIELSQGRLISIPCRVNEFLEKRAEQIEHDKRANVAKAAKIRQLKTFISKNKAGANTASQARSKQKQLERIDLAEIESHEALARIRLPIIDEQRKTVFECSDLVIGYDNLKIASKINLEIEPGEKIAVCGDNGQGKTTFIKTITNAIPKLGGDIKWGHGITFGVYAQHVYSDLPSNLSIREYLLSQAKGKETDKRVLDIAAGFLFTGDDVNKRIEVLSGGERARLSLASLFLSGANVLVLDEPSNHLDVETSDALAIALNEYKGTVLFVSHQRSFTEKVATAVLEVNNGQLRRYNGGYDLYLERLESETDLTNAGSPDIVNDNTANVSKEVKSTKKLGRERFEAEKRINTIERQIEKFDKKLVEMTNKLHKIEDWQEAANFGEEIQKVQDQKDIAEEEWLELHEKIEELSN